MDKHLHIVALDVPWPADYGGVVDLFYKLKALHQLGVKIHLHCFTQPGRPPQDELNKYCVSVHYYQRSKNLSSFSMRLPFIVKSRKNEELITNLNKDNYPVLLEGIHCTYYLHSGALQNRKVIVRLHNVEFEYYKQLAKNESHFLKKLYFLNESRLLYQYEKSIAGKAGFITVSEHDVKVYQQLFNAKDIAYLPVFIPHTLAAGKEGKGCFCLYHGNLSINENETAATWLLQNVFNTLEIPFVIAGKNPSKKLQDLAHAHKHTCIVANPGEKEMQDMICKAQIHVLPSFNNTGIKLKLLNALFNGRHCVVNSAGVDGSGLEEACHIASDAGSFKKIITALYQQSFTEQEKEKRQGLLQRIFNNEANAKKLMAAFEREA
ncbi:glycosyltransferase family protein [Ferruginibacter profundus]